MSPKEMMASRRALLGGGAALAAGAAAAASALRAGSTPLPFPPPPTTDGYADHRAAKVIRAFYDLDAPSDIESAAIRAFRQHAHEEADKHARSLRRRAERLEDLRSISPAYRRYRLQQLDAEVQNVWSRLNTLTDGL